MPSDLCLACSSSLPPRSHTEIFNTPCCGRPICPNCLKSNPRLARYDPCLACLAGVDAVASSRTHQPKNINGAVRDEDTYVIGDEDEDLGSASDSGNEGHRSAHQAEVNDIQTTAPDTDSVYHIKHGDTLQGIAFKLRIDARELCRVNKLPPSTMNTTPHLLHTRTSLTLPGAASTDGITPPNQLKQDTERRQRRARECAAKRLQVLTKEIDWHTAKAYVALADDPELVVQQAAKAKEMGENVNASLEGLAVAQYLDDEEWEQSERRARASINKQSNGNSQGWWRRSKS